MAGERILITDDEEGVRRLLARTLSNAGYKVDMAADGAAALAALRMNRYDLCLTDLKLPDIGGIEVLGHARKLHPDCEVIILTGYGDMGSAIEALRLGAYDYMQKPILDQNILRVAVARALERQRITRHNQQLLRDLERANQELQGRRKKQMQYINYVGEALSASFKAGDIAEVCIQATLAMAGCDGAGMLLLQPYSNGGPALIYGARYALSAAQVDQIVDTLYDALDKRLRPPLERTGIVAMVEPGADAAPDRKWQFVRTSLLMAHEDPIGVALLSSFDEAGPDEDSLELFGFLTNQASTALENARLFVRANELATRDGVTGLYNHRHYFDMLDAEISRAVRHGQQLAVIMLDLDKAGGLKFVNDSYGHLAGDELLQHVAAFLLQHVRRADVVARYGGDEFIILAPQTGPEQARTLAERICTQLAGTTFEISGHPLSVTVSVGVAVFTPDQNLDADRLVREADRELYVAKECGGNCVSMADSTAPALACPSV
ncbi:MAG: diguanylate cyclase [Chloroflexi bacterium]|nr:diguanylate cyclase [Chloroflexota bacterium]